MQEVDWEKIWEERMKERESEVGRGIDCGNEGAEDYADYVKTSDIDHGRKIRQIFEKEGILEPTFEVLDIGSGPGSIAIPFAELVKKVTAVEPAEEMCKFIVKNAKGPPYN